MKAPPKTVEVKLIDYLKYKETHGLFINGELQYRGTKLECMFFQLKLQPVQGPKESRNAVAYR